MRKLLVILLAICAMVWFPAASPWEGAASVAPAGELPSTGFFVATNSFPRNTVVDITNIETGKSTRAIVAKTLNSPGLLAIVSNEAAQLIGMRAGSVCRIQMVQPTDPIAYLRFTENVNSYAPNYDSGDVITEETLVAEVYSDDTYRPQIIETPEPVLPEPEQQVESTSSRITGPGYFMEPEWGGNDRLNIVDLPGYEIEPRDPVYIAPPVEIAEMEDRTEPFDDIKEPVYIAGKREVIKDVSERYEEREPLPVVKDVPDFWAEKQANEIEKEASIYLAEEQKKEVIKDTYAYVVEEPRDEVIKEIFDREEYVAIAEETPKYEEVPVIDETPKAEEPIYQYNLVETEELPPPKSVYGIDPSDIIPGIAQAEPEKQSPPQQAAPSSTPPEVNRLPSLISGKYYVQIAALPAETYESTLWQIDKGYPVVIIDRDNLYRILIGPLNQGESAAVLARFKSIGYTDAFVRRGN